MQSYGDVLNTLTQAIKIDWKADALVKLSAC